MKYVSILLSLLLVVGLFPDRSWALSGSEQISNEESTLMMMADANKFREIVPEISVDDALGVATLLQNLGEDTQIKLLVERLKKAEVEQDPIFQNFLEGATKSEIVQGLAQIFDELKAIEILFRDPKSAVEHFYEDGMVQAGQRLEKYREDPSLLEQDLRSGLQFSFVSYAIAGDFL